MQRVEAQQESKLNILLPFLLQAEVPPDGLSRPEGILMQGAEIEGLPPGGVHRRGRSCEIILRWLAGGSFRFRPRYVRQAIPA